MSTGSGDMCSVDVKRYEKLKFLLLTIAFCLVIGAYTIVKELKDTVFVGIVGNEYLPKAKFLVIFFLIPAALLYSKLVDNIRRYQLLSFYCFLYGAILLGFTYYLGSPEYGLANTQTSPWRFFGWAFYFILEGFSPFVVGVFWAFANSVSDPREAKASYATMVAGSKIGGMATAIFAWYMMTNLRTSPWFNFSDTLAHQILLSGSALLLLCVPIVIYILMGKVPGRYLHGYEVVYKEEKKNSKAGTSSTGMFSGLQILLESPYILGIFALVFFYESLNVVLNFQRICLLKDAATTEGVFSLSGFTGSMFLQTFWMHFIGMFLSFFGVRLLLKRYGEKFCLLMIPALVALLLIYFMIVQTPDAMLCVFTGLRAINYSFSKQLSESLYIPTMKDIKFKAKSWIDSFGTKISKSAGSIFVDVVKNAVPGTASFYYVYTTFFSILIGAWFVTAFLLGRRYEKAVASNEIIQS
ncbi:MAG: Npt1/Npt2 family nucleotide transporter [Candidatus Chromulinivorax sp.]|nr:Npt1/Npt2 family nucleotide transporter [Candidatus Chromulinivorax sp.]